MTFQHTLAQAIKIEGKGLHTGKQCGIEIAPAEVDSGICFMCEGQCIPAKAEYVVSTQRATTLGCNGKQIATIEHLLAALNGFGIDNALINVEGVDSASSPCVDSALRQAQSKSSSPYKEIPVLDGSARDFIKYLKKAKRRKQTAQIRQFELSNPVWIAEKDSLIVAVPGSEFRVTYIGDFPGLGAQVASYELNATVFGKEIAPARTTVLQEEIEEILVKGLGQGGSLENVVILKADGPPEGMRFNDEPVRHKLLDLIGDLTLLGMKLKAHIIGIRSGHRLNIELVKKLNSLSNSQLVKQKN